jgi:hypothetical protein
LIITLVTDKRNADEPMAAATVVVQDDETIDSVDRRRKHSSFLVIIHYTDNTLSTLPETHSLLNKGTTLSKPPPNPSGSASKAKKKGKGKAKFVFDGILVPPISIPKPVDEGYDGDTNMGM